MFLYSGHIACLPVVVYKDIYIFKILAMFSDLFSITGKPDDCFSFFTVSNC